METALETIRSLVRPLTTLAFVATIIYLTIMGQVSADFLLGQGSGIIAFWFGTREKEKASTEPGG